MIHELRPIFRNLRIFSSIAPSNTSNKRSLCTGKACYSNYNSSKPEGDPSLYTKFEVTRNPEEWKFVERLLPLPVVPVPTPKEEYPSGWKPPTAKPENFPFFVERNANHLIPVYLNISHRGTRKLTLVRNVTGDIWYLRDTLVKYLEDLRQTPVGVQTNELASRLIFRGDYYSDIVDWLEQRGF